MRIVLTGASGQLGTYLRDHYASSTAHELIPWLGEADVDLRDYAAIRAALVRDRPDAVLHVGAISSTAAVSAAPDLARAVNFEATAAIAFWCAGKGTRLIFASTDLVFDGRFPFYREADPAIPVLAYGETKVDAEPTVEFLERGLVVRLALLYGRPRAAGRPTYFSRQVDQLRSGQSIDAFSDEFRTPLHLADAARALAALVESKASGIVHLGGPERLSRWELMQKVARHLGIDPGLVRPQRQADAPGPEPRPRDVSLDCTRWETLRLGTPRRTVEQLAPDEICA